MRRILVTGASGFVGAHAVPALAARGFAVHALGRTKPAADATHHGVTHHPVDLLDAGAVRPLVAALGASHLLHLAWYAEPGLYWRSGLNLDWVAATLSLVRAFHEAGGERVVGAGTCAEYTWGPAHLAEDAPCAPATLYGAAKDAARRVLDAYGRESGLSVAWGRLFFLYGPGERPGRLVGDAARLLRAGARFATSHGRQRRDFSHVADVGAALAALVDSTVAGPVNVGSGHAVPVRLILETVGRLTGRTDLIDFGARPLAATEPAVIEADVGRLRDAVGFTPHYDLERGLAQTLAATMPG